MLEQRRRGYHAEVPDGQTEPRGGRQISLGKRQAQCPHCRNWHLGLDGSGFLLPEQYSCQEWLEVTDFRSEDERRFDQAVGRRF